MNERCPAPVITPIPDDNTSEAIVYGSAYKFAKKSSYFWDAMADMKRKELRALEGQIIDREFAHSILTRNRYLINARKPPTNSVNELRDLSTLRRIMKVRAVLDEINVRKKENLMWARQVGISEYVSRSMAGGIDERTWKAATAEYSTEPIDYETIRRLRDGDDRRNKIKTPDVLEKPWKRHGSADGWGDGPTEPVERPSTPAEDAADRHPYWTELASFLGSVYPDCESLLMGACTQCDDTLSAMRDWLTGGGLSGRMCETVLLDMMEEVLA